MSPTPDDPPPDAEDDLLGEHLPLTDLERIGTRPPFWHKHGTQITLTALALVVAATVLWNSIGPGKPQTTPQSTPLTTVSALLVSNVTNATVTLNGQKLAGHLPMSVVAYLETDGVTISAPRFRQQTCQFQGLLTQADDPDHCLFTIDSSEAQNGPSYVMGVFLLPDDLLPGQHNQTIELILQQLTTAWHTTVQPGDYIPTAFLTTNGDISDQRAAAPVSQAVVVTHTPLSCMVPMAQQGPCAPDRTRFLT